MSTEYRIVGPPGTGKTSTIARQVTVAAETYGPDRILVTSLTRAAAAEAAGRHLPIPRQHVSTLHAQAYRALGRPTLAETREGIDAWNQQLTATETHLRLTPPTTRDRSDHESNGREDAPGADDQAAAGDGDATFTLLNSLRATLTPASVWPEHVREFWTRWQTYKLDAGRLDWADLIELATDTPPPIPGLRAIFVDEAQDLDRAQMRLVRSWARDVRSLVIVGDGDQCLYSWRGSDPHVMLEPPLPDEHLRVLEQSYRVPRAVHAAASAWIGQVAHRLAPRYRPRDEDGFVAWGSRDPADVVEAAHAHAAAGRQIMILASCAYQLEPYRTELRRRGVPFANRYRRRRGDWNPLYAAPGRTPAGSRLLAFLRADGRFWTLRDLWCWAEWLDARWLVRGAKAAIKRLVEEDGDYARSDLLIPDLLSWFSPDAVGAAVAGDLDWLEAATLESHRAQYHYPRRVLATCGPAGLRDEPRVTFGTIHSCKGGEADLVFLLPDLSYAAALAAATDPDALYRLFYVGMTRARDELVLCEPGPGPAVEWGPALKTT